MEEKNKAINFLFEQLKFNIEKQNKLNELSIKKFKELEQLNLSIEKQKKAIVLLFEQLKFDREKQHELEQLNLSIEEQKKEVILLFEQLKLNIEKEEGLKQLSIEEQKEFDQLKINNELKFEVIVTSKKYEQIIIYITMSKDISEKQFIDNILKSLNKKYFNTLVKLSCCQLYCENDNDLKEFLLKSNGKYYFNGKGILQKS
jgi:hypothetical protein